MTHDACLPTLEQIMNGNPYELVDSPFSKDKMEAWRAQSIALGASGALAAFHRLYEMARNDAADASARADAAQAREALVAHLCDQVALFLPPRKRGVTHSCARAGGLAASTG
jgi:hypothetical protein